MSVDLSIIIVNWNVRDYLRDCLRSIDANRGDLVLEVIVVDSASSDGSVEMVAAEFPWVRLMIREDNVGFPRGNNLGLAASHGRAILLLNPDTVILGDAISVMFSYLMTHADVGALGPQLLNPDGSVQSSRRRFPSLLTAFFESTWLDRLAPNLLRHYYALDLPDGEPAEVDWLTGACIMAPRAVYERIGGLDEAYYMYSEELDWCRRIKEAGWRVLYFPEARTVHHYGKSSEQAVTARHINFNRAKLRYFRKYHGPAAAAILRLFLLIVYVWQMKLEGLKWLAGSQRELRRQRIRAYYDVVRSGLSPAGY